MNLMNRRTPLSYDWVTFFCVAAGECDHPADRTSLPFLPSLSLQVRW